MDKAKLHALVEEVWRRKVSMASIATESLNALGSFKDEMHKEIDALDGNVSGTAEADNGSHRDPDSLVGR
jgi:hypothetical protein